MAKLAEEVARRSENPRVLFRHARALVPARRLRLHAVAELERAIALSPEDRAFAARARALARATRTSLAGAIVLHRDFLARVPDEATAWDELGTLLMDIDDFPGRARRFPILRGARGQESGLRTSRPLALLSLARYPDAEARLKAGQALVEAGDTSGSKLAFLANLRRAQDGQKLHREEDALVAGERVPRDHEEVNLFATFLRARSHYVASSLRLGSLPGRSRADSMKINYWDAAKSAGFAAEADSSRGPLVLARASRRVGLALLASVRARRRLSRIRRSLPRCMRVSCT